MLSSIRQGKKLNAGHPRELESISLDLREHSKIKCWPCGGTASEISHIFGCHPLVLD